MGLCQVTVIVVGSPETIPVSFSHCWLSVSGAVVIKELFRILRYRSTSDVLTLLPFWVAETPQKCLCFDSWPWLQHCYCDHERGLSGNCRLRPLLFFSRPWNPDLHTSLRMNGIQLLCHYLSALTSANLLFRRITPGRFNWLPLFNLIFRFPKISSSETYFSDGKRYIQKCFQSAVILLPVAQFRLTVISSGRSFMWFRFLLAVASSLLSSYFRKNMPQ